MKLTTLKISITVQVLCLILFALPEGPQAEARSFLRQESDEPKTISPAAAKQIISARARQVLLALKAGDMARFSTFVHPQKGVRFSPYAQVLPDEDRVLKKDQLAQMWAGQKRYKWGGYDGSGDPIWLTLKKYHRRFIFDHDFSRAE